MQHDGSYEPPIVTVRGAYFEAGWEKRPKRPPLTCYLHNTETWNSITITACETRSFWEAIVTLPKGEVPPGEYYISMGVLGRKSSPNATTINCFLRFTVRGTYNQGHLPAI